MPRHLVALIALFLLATPSARAQAMHHSRPQRADSVEHEQMMAKLNLTADQKTQIDAIHKKYGMHMRSAGDSSGMGQMKPMRSSDSTMKQGMAEVRAVLRPEQQVLFDSMTADHMKQHPMHQPMHNGPPHHGMRG